MEGLDKPAAVSTTTPRVRRVDLNRPCFLSVDVHLAFLAFARRNGEDGTIAFYSEPLIQLYYEGYFHPSAHWPSYGYILPRPFYRIVDEYVSFYISTFQPYFMALPWGKLWQATPDYKRSRDCSLDLRIALNDLIILKLGDRNESSTTGSEADDAEYSTGSFSVAGSGRMPEYGSRAQQNAEFAEGDGETRPDFDNAEFVKAIWEEYMAPEAKKPEKIPVVPSKHVLSTRWERGLLRDGQVQLVTVVIRVLLHRLRTLIQAETTHEAVRVIGILREIEWARRILEQLLTSSTFRSERLEALLVKHLVDGQEANMVVVRKLDDIQHAADGASHRYLRTLVKLLQLEQRDAEN
ncbi:hypothetical protein BJ508DRAFT_416430 [Ascobolus immersus RN42]|uniref:Uncharacterized protein n=1 Tax=Ascobolus immersus RN42 TaxID=1160509 RepID=A0A3N4HYF1_ASCIM|nr:hypothetical protein BJ508DRAFT_416430 [Ascobolus immersus RN42]